MQVRYLLACLCLCGMQAASAEDWNAHVQSTYILVHQDSFRAPYSGAFSLLPQAASGHSLSATAGFGTRLWDGAEAYLDAEMIQGHPLSDLHGLGGLTNGEQQKSAGAGYVLYRARAFLRHSWPLSTDTEDVASDMNQLAGQQATRRLVLTAGNLAASDIFDANAYAHDPRTAFFNSALMANGAWDYAADARGYTWGAALEYINGKQAWRIGRFAVPRESNGLPLDHALARHHADQVEFEQGYEGGAVRLLVFRNVERMGAFADALALQPSAPDLATVRRDQVKRGFGLSWDQDLRPGLGAFARLGASDGHTETYSFAEIEQTASTGVVLQGAAWQRPQDKLGLAVAVNGLHGAHRAYLMAGGHGAFIGDGALSYGREQTWEAWYGWQLTASVNLTFDLQHTLHPGYNAGRGPVNFGALRLHFQQ